MPDHSKFDLATFDAVADAYECLDRAIVAHTTKALEALALDGLPLFSELKERGKYESYWKFNGIHVDYDVSGRLKWGLTINPLHSTHYDPPRYPAACPDDWAVYFEVVRRLPSVKSARFTPSEKISESTGTHLLPLPKRVTNPLVAEGLHTVADIVQVGRQKLLRVPNFGMKGLLMLVDLLAANHIELGA